MNDTIVSGGPDGHPTENPDNDTPLRLLARWLLHCHERTRRRQQLGVLEPQFRDSIGVNHADIDESIEAPFWH